MGVAAGDAGDELRHQRPSLHRGSEAEGALPFLPSLAWRAQLSYTNAGDRSTAKYLLTNTGVKELDYSLALGWRGEHLSLESYFSQYQNKAGFFLGSPQECQ